MGKPLILIVPSTQLEGAEFSDRSLSLAETYPRAVLAAGGLPVVLSCTPAPDYLAESVARCQGVLLSGGEDIQPELYAPRTARALRETVTITEPERDLVEALLIPEIFQQKKPLFAICRGQQMLNVSFGGTLYVDLARQRPDAIPHKVLERKNQPVHDVHWTPGSLVASLLDGVVTQVNSTHHQAIDRLAPPFRVTGQAPDGIIEAIELLPEEAGRLPWFLGVQFHPERLYGRYPPFLELFRAFVAACSAP